MAGGISWRFGAGPTATELLAKSGAAFLSQDAQYVALDFETETGTAIRVILHKHSAREFLLSLSKVDNEIGVQFPRE